MERAVAAGDPPVSAKHPADEEWLAAQQNWLASRRTAARALQKHKTAARRVGRAALAPHRAPGARAVRLICFSCGRTRPATICQAPVVSLREAGRNKPWRGTSSSSSSWIRRASHAARAATAQPAHPDRARIAHAAHICCVQVLLARTHQWQHARRRAAGTFDGSATRRSRLSASRASVAFRVSCTSRCKLNTSGLGSGLGLCVCSPQSCECRVSSERRGSSLRA